MTEAEWLETNRPLAMLRHLRDAADPQRYPDRKFRLFACAAQNDLLSGLSDHRTWQAVATAVRFAEGLADSGLLENARRAARDVAIQSWQDFQSGDGREDDWMAAQAAVDVTLDKGILAAWEVCQAMQSSREYADKRPRCELLREFFGNPFRPPVLPKGWRRWNDGVILRLAQQIYDEQRRADLPVLADALEEAGCTDAGILSHCRSAKEHVRGCWVLDLVRVED